MKQVLLLAAIYSLVIYQSQKKEKEKVSPAPRESIGIAKRSIAKAASLPLKLYQESLQQRKDAYSKTGSPTNMMLARFSYKH